jgi:peptidoglycan/xylan/chitin deacetylase (PgdA/CDA1 family)
MSANPPRGSRAGPALGRTRSRLRRLLQPHAGSPDIFSSERSFSPPIGERVGPADRPRGYYIDFSAKLSEPVWPPAWIREQPPDEHFHIASVQWALGAWERYLAGEGEAWRQAALDCAESLLVSQESEGANDGAWLHWVAMTHTFRVDPPWASGITQGEAASLFVRLHVETGEERFADAAVRALMPMKVPLRAGGLLAELHGFPFFEEYPTRPASLVLNGAIFSLWGFRDVATALGDDNARGWYEQGVDGLVSILDRYDTGYWSRYDLYPHPVVNVASPAYHLLHIKQLEVLNRLTPRPELERTRARFESYRASPGDRRRALATKVAFRLATPRNSLLAKRLPWNDGRRLRRGQDIVVLCYHGVSEDWRSSLAVTPSRLSQQVRYMLDQGYRPATFSEAVLGPRSEKTFAVTFDDAYLSVATLGLPVLERAGIPATVFVPTAFAGRTEPMEWRGIHRWIGGPHEDELRPLSWEQLEQLAEIGWEIGSHTRTHPHLPEIADDQLADELRGSREDLEQRLGRPCLSLVYPYGDYDERVIRATAKAGYAAAATLAESEQTPLTWPRVGVYDIDHLRRFKLKVSRRARAIRHARNAQLHSGQGR